MVWLREPVVLTRRVVIAFGLMLGLLLAAGILSVADRFDRFEDQRRTEAEVAAIAKRVFRIETPTDRELQSRVMRALEICAQEPDCLRSLNRTVGQASSLIAEDLDGEPSGPGGSAPQESPQEPSGAPRPPDGPRGRVPPPEPPGGGERPRPPGSPVPAPPRRPVDVEIPQIGPVRIPPICTPVVAVNCRP